MEASTSASTSIVPSPPQERATVFRVTTWRSVRRRPLIGSRKRANGGRTTTTEGGNAGVGGGGKKEKKSLWRRVRHAFVRNGAARSLRTSGCGDGISSANQPSVLVPHSNPTAPSCPTMPSSSSSSSSLTSSAPTSASAPDPAVPALEPAAPAPASTAPAPASAAAPSPTLTTASLVESTPHSSNGNDNVSPCEQNVKANTDSEGGMDSDLGTEERSVIDNPSRKSSPTGDPSSTDTSKPLPWPPHSPQSHSAKRRHHHHHHHHHDHSHHRATTTACIPLLISSNSSPTLSPPHVQPRPRTIEFRSMQSVLEEHYRILQKQDQPQDQSQNQNLDQDQQQQRHELPQQQQDCSMAPQESPENEGGGHSDSHEDSTGNIMQQGDESGTDSNTTTKTTDDGGTSSMSQQEGDTDMGSTTVTNNNSSDDQTPDTTRSSTTNDATSSTSSTPPSDSDGDQDSSHEHSNDSDRDDGKDGDDNDNGKSGGGEDEGGEEQVDFIERYMTLHSSYRQGIAALHFLLCQYLHRRLLDHRRAVRQLQAQMFRAISGMPPMLKDLVQERLAHEMMGHLDGQRRCARRIGKALRVELKQGLLTLDTTEADFEGVPGDDEDNDEDGERCSDLDIISMRLDMARDRVEEGVDPQWPMYGWRPDQKPFVRWDDVYEARAQLDQVQVESEVEAEVEAEDEDEVQVEVEGGDDMQSYYDHEGEEQEAIQVDEEQVQEPLQRNEEESQANTDEARFNLQDIIEATRHRLRQIRECLAQSEETDDDGVVPVVEVPRDSRAPHAIQPSREPSDRFPLSEEASSSHANAEDATDPQERRTRTNQPDPGTGSAAITTRSRSRSGRHRTVEDKATSTTMPATRGESSNRRSRARTNNNNNHRRVMMGNNVTNHFQGGIHYHYGTAPCYHTTRQHHSHRDCPSGDSDDYDNDDASQDGRSSSASGSQLSLYGTPRSQSPSSERGSFRQESTLSISRDHTTRARDAAASSSDTHMDHASAELGTTDMSQSASPSPNPSNAHERGSAKGEGSKKTRHSKAQIKDGKYEGRNQGGGGGGGRQSVPSEEIARVDRWMIRYASALARARVEYPEDVIDEEEQDDYARLPPPKSGAIGLGDPYPLDEEWIRKLHWKEARLMLEGRRDEARELKKKRQALVAFMRSDTNAGDPDQLVSTLTSDALPDRDDGRRGKPFGRPMWMLGHGRVEKKTAHRQRQILRMLMKRKRACDEALPSDILVA